MLIVDLLYRIDRVVSESGSEANDVRVLGLNVPLAIAKDLLPEAALPKTVIANGEPGTATNPPGGEIAKAEPSASGATETVSPSRCITCLWNFRGI